MKQGRRALQLRSSLLFMLKLWLRGGFKKFEDEYKSVERH